MVLAGEGWKYEHDVTKRVLESLTKHYSCVPVTSAAIVVKPTLPREVVELTVRFTHISAFLTVCMQPRCLTPFAKTSKPHNHCSGAPSVIHER